MLTLDERAAARAFLQRCEVRMSTVHRVASALLSGAGIMVLLPTVARDSLVRIIRTLVNGPIGNARVSLVIAVLLTVAVPVSALWLLLKEMTRFYFHGEHHVGRGDTELFLPRFTLSGLKLPNDELTPEAQQHLVDLRNSPPFQQLLVPPNDRFRNRIDQQYLLYKGHLPADITDTDRVSLLLEFAATRDRELLGEVAKMENGMSRHLLRIQVLVLRYTKALIVLITTAAATFAADAAIEGSTTASVDDAVWIGVILALWAPAVLLAVTSPVRWLMRTLKSSGADASVIRDDREITHFEDIAVRVALLTWVVTAGSVLWLVASADVSTVVGVWAVFAVFFTAVVLMLGLVRWDGSRVWRRLLGRHR